MKLKYYLRGIGIGVIVATLIMTVSSVIHNNNLSEEKIIKEAQKLGMIMPENTEGLDRLWSEKDTEVSTENVSDTQLSEDTQISDDTQVSEQTTPPVEKTTVKVTITDEDGAKSVSRKLLEAGVVTDAEDFLMYLSDNGYKSVIRSGIFEIPVGVSYEEICDIIIRNN